MINFKFKNNIYYRGVACMMEELFWPIIIILIILYLLFTEVKSYKYKRSLKLKIKYIEEDIVEMKIVNKLFFKGYAFKDYRLPDTCIIELEYEDNKYEINDEEIFNSYEIGQFIKIKLVENLDENKELINYELYKLK